MTDFDTWQAQQCALLEISTEEHNKLLALARELQTINPAIDCYGILWDLCFNWRTELTTAAIQQLGLVID